MTFAQNTRDELRFVGDGKDVGALAAQPGMKQQTYLLGSGDDATSSAFDPKPDGPRYAACGDAVTVNVAEWIGRRLAMCEELKQAA